MSRRLLITASILLLSVCSAAAQAPSPEALTTARSLVTTMKLPDQYKPLLPGILVALAFLMAIAAAWWREGR